MIKKTEIQVLKNEIIEKDEIISKLLLSLNQIKTENILEVIHNEVYEKKLRVFNAKYRAVIETLEIGITIQDENLNIIDANKSAGEILGLSIDQMQGRSSFDPRWRAIHVDGSDYPGETHPTVITMRTGQPLIDQIMGVHKPSGELTWISINTIPMWGGDNGEQNGVVVFFKDITATKKNQEEKIRNQKLLLESESIGKLGGWELDLITNQLYWTDETYKIHETTPKEYTPTVEKSFDFYLEESKNQLISAFEVAKTSGIGYDLYLQIKTEQGNIKDVRTTCKITFKENIPIKLTGIIQDITKQKKLEYNLKEEKEKYKLLFNNNPIPLALFDAESLKFLNVNEAFCKQYGYNYDEFSNMSLLDIKPEDEFELVKEMVKKVDTEVVNIGVFRHRKKNNEVIKVEIIRHEIIYEGKRAKLVLVNDVTEKLKIEEEIKIVSKSALDFKNAVFSASIISIADKKGLITFVNKNFIDISGFSEIELIGKNHRIINSGVHSKEFWQDMWQTILSGKTWRNEVKNRAKDGTYYWVDTFIIPFIDDDGEITQLLSIRNDITEKKNSELELILNKKAVESALEGIVITDASLPDNPIIYSNERFTIITGYSKEDVYGKNCRFLQGAETDPELIKKIKNAVKSKEDFEVEILNYKKDGTKFWNYLRISRIQNNEGVVTHFAGFQNDITQRKLAELMLIEREKSFQDIFNFSPVPLVISSIEEREILMVNDSFSNLLGIEANNLIGENTFHFFSKDFDRTNLLIELEKNGEFLNLEFKIILENNEEIDCLISITKIKINNNLVYLTSIIDIRKIKETENSLIEAKEYAEEMSRLKSTFLANMSHELRTPMNGILGFSELMKDIDDVEEIKEISEFIHSSAKRLTDTLNLILDISSIESGILNIVYSEVDLVEVIKENIKLFSQLALKKGLYLKYTSDIDKLIVYSNSQVLNSILNNLINNAIKFTNEGGVTIELDFINDNENEKFDTKGYIIRVIDTGIGIDEKDFELIFSAFRQVSEGISRSYEGSGLGLTLTRKYLEVMNGNISVESELGKGTTFIVKLPFEQQID